MIWTWLKEAFANLPGCDDDIFKGLWLKRRLRFGNQAPDQIDEYSARLVCAALRHCTRLFVVLSDSQASRPSLLFATALIRSWYDSRIQQSGEDGCIRQKILYFGSAIGVRTQLSQVRIEGKAWELNLSEVFQQQNIGKKQQNVGKGKKTKKFSEAQPITLPEVITIYSPVDPVFAIEQHNPQWIAIDCSDAESLRWLEPLLKYSLEKQIPILAWGQNPLSECAGKFAEYGQVFTWSSQPMLEIARPSQPECKLQLYLYPDKTTQIQPVVLEGASANKLSISLREANRLLASTFEIASGRFAKDAIRVHWKYLRALESLSVPLEFYETEATSFWGLKSLKQLSDECEHFREACNHNIVNLAARLEQVHAFLEVVAEHIKNAGSPLWQALCDLVVKEPPVGEARFIVFISRARKQLFLLALLARHNRTEEDLYAVRTWVFSLDEFQKLKCQHELSLSLREPLNFLAIDKTLRWHPIFVGLPSPLLTPKLLSVLSQQNIDFLLYGHQTLALARQVTQWAKRLSPNISDMATLLSQLSGLEVPQELPLIPPRLNLNELSGLDAGNITKPRSIGIKPLWQPEDPVSEIARLLESEQALMEDGLGIEVQFQEDSEMGIALEQESWCESAIEIHFEHDWHVCFAPDDMINVIVTGAKGQQVDKRYIRVLKPNDRVIAIPDQRRQSLYDLILSQVHGHPTIELHLALIRRWQQDLELAYRRWRLLGVRNLDELLWQMQRRGSTLTHPMTLRGWLSGNILCPEDADDLRRLAEILEMNFVQSHYQKIDRAAKRLRGLHRSLARRLNSWIEEQVSDSIRGKYDDVIDSELGITFDDFRNSLLILQIKKVQPIIGLFLRSNLGKFERISSE
ncbi:DrmE family protein [Altericista sp. CCNU0014]|uniref:DrmE family protein n=1 Tax=Altericista sp. CCNU0014 TaxID=3082949 RepID=UPI0038509C64